VRHFLITAACIAALPTLAAAQAAVPAPPASTDSVSNESSGFMFRVGGFTGTAERNYAFNNSATAGTGSLKGIEAVLRGSGIGLSFRSLTGSFTNTIGGGAPLVVTSADASLLLGPQAFTVFVGASKRALSYSTLATQVYTFGRLGVQMSFLIGGTGLRAQVGGWGYIPTDSTMKIGGEGEGSIIYTPPRIPVYFQLGYRTEVFTSKSSSTNTTPEEVRGLRIGGGIQFGGK
jgi:hypothetical protein